jgi:pyruvate dehydrogenase E2 component (dihydrolipoamide acetyltransferase)
MSITVIMPALEMAQETGKLLSWRKKEGEHVNKGEPLLEVETDKAVVEIEAAGEGILAGIKAHEGDVIPVGQTIAWLLQPGESVPAEVAQSQSGRRQDSEPAKQSAAATSAPAAGAETGARISPKARRLARERGVDISRITGSGAGGEILAGDILAVADTATGADAPALGTATASPAGTTAGSGVARTGAAASAQGSASSVETLTAIGRLMAERTTQSWTTVPHFFVTREIDAGELIAAHDRLGLEAEKERGVKPTHTDLLIALVARVLVQHPRMNASWTGSGVKLNPEINIGVAMAVNDGVVVAVIPSADTKRVFEIAHARRDLTARARSGHLQPSDIGGATFTISNLGMYGVDAFTAIIVPPQAAIMAIARIAERVVAVEGRPGIRPMLTLTLSTDHRVADGARAASFVNDLAAAIAAPTSLLR